jgi:cation diffusion facilitator family transporter
VNSLAGFAGALLLAVFAAIMAWESLGRLFGPVAIAFDEAIVVAMLGLVVNGVSVALLGVEEKGHDEHAAHGHAHHDHSLRSAYLHVLADALTSILAILALVSGKYLSFGWMDPAMGIVGAALVARWSFGLLRDTSKVLLDRQAPEDLRRRVRAAMETEPGDRVSDLHVWSVGPGIYAAIISVVTDDPAISSRFKERLPADLGIVHASIEIERCDAGAPRG